MTTPNLINMLANPTSYNPVTGKVTILSTIPSGVSSVDNEGVGLGLVNNTDPENPKIKSLLHGINSTSGEEANIYRIEYNEPVGNNHGYAAVNNDNSIIISSQDDTSGDNIEYFHEINPALNNNIIESINHDTGEFSRLNLTTTLSSLSVNNSNINVFNLINTTNGSLIEYNNSSANILSRSIVSGSEVNNIIENTALNNFAYCQQNINTNDVISALGTVYNLGNYNLRILNDKFYLDGIVSSSGANDKILSFNSVTGEFNFDDLPSGSVNIYNSDGQIDNTRNVDLQGYDLNFIGDNISSEFNVSANEVNLSSGSNQIDINSSGITLTTVSPGDIILQSSADIIIEPINNLRFVSLDNVIPAGNNVIYFDPLTSNVTYGSAPSGSNIYNSDGALTSNRTVNTGTFSLTFNATTGFMSWNAPRYTFNNSADFRLSSLNTFNTNTSVLTYGALGRVSQTSILSGTIWTKQICSLSVPNITIPTVTTQTLNNLTVPATYGYQQNAGLISVNLVNGTFTSGSDNTGFYYYSFQCTLSITAVDAGIVDIFLNSSVDGVVYTIRENFTAGQNKMINFYKDIFIATNNNIFTFQVNNQTTGNIDIINPYSSICVNRI
jgi:hypothetical protein